MDFLDIPEDILEVILVQLEPEACCRFGEVSKQCYSLVTGSSLWVQIAARRGLGDLQMDENPKATVLLQLRRFTWTDTHNPGVHLFREGLVAEADNGNWNGCLAGPVHSKGVKVWGAKVYCNPEEHNVFTFRYGIMDEFCKPTTEQMERSHLGDAWFDAPAGATTVRDGFRFASINEYQSTDSVTPFYRRQGGENLVPTPIYLACRLVLTEQRRTFEIYGSNGLQCIWTDLPTNTGFVPAASLSGDKTGAEFLPHITSSAHIKEIIPWFNDETELFPLGKPLVKPTPKDVTVLSSNALDGLTDGSDTEGSDSGSQP